MSRVTKAVSIFMLTVSTMLLLNAAPSRGGTIETIAGGLSGQMPAVDVNLYYPFYITSDGQGNLYIADINHRVHKVDAAGNVTTVAGNGAPGYQQCYTGAFGDGGPAVEASLNSPSGLAIDGEGNLYIAEQLCHRVRKVDTNGIITTVAGSGYLGFMGDGGPAVNARLYQPRGLAVDSAGNLYIADQINDRIRKVDTNGIITTVAGALNYPGYGLIGDGGPADNTVLEGPSDVEFDSAGNMYIVEQGNNVIRMVDTSGIISTVVGNGTSGSGGDGGPATEAQLSRPTAMDIDTDGTIYIADWTNLRIRKVDTSGTISFFAGCGPTGFTGSFSGDGGPATAACLNQPVGVAADGSGGVFIADRLNNRIRLVDTSGIIDTVVGNGEPGYSGDGLPGTYASLSQPAGVAVDAAGNIYIGDNKNRRVRKLDINGIITTVAGNGSRDFSGEGGPATEAGIVGAIDVAVAADGTLYVLGSFRLMAVTPDGTINTIAGNGSGGTVEGGGEGDGGPAIDALLRYPSGIELDANGNIYIGEEARVRMIDGNGIITTVAGNGIYASSGDGGPATEASIANAYDMTFDSAGNMYIAEYYANRVRKVDTNGIITTVAGNGTIGYTGDGGPATEATLYWPYGVATDSADNLYIADAVNRCIRKVDTAGIITTVAGTGVAGFSGDGGEATEATMSNPFSVAVDSDGNIIISDMGNHRIRRVEADNLMPVADAGADVTIHTGNLVTLDGSGSSDPDMNYPLSYQWTIIDAPPASTAVLNGTDTMAPSFIVDKPGDYTVSLVVFDSLGLASLSDEVLISTFNSAPVADAGEDQLVIVLGTTVILDGTQSYDDDGDPITFSWTMTALPSGSTAVLIAPASATPNFVADVQGTYVVELTVNDPWIAGTPDSVMISFNNLPPVADAGVNQSVIQWDTVLLDGSGSSDANGDPLTFLWTVASAPAGSTAALSDPSAAQPIFVPDLPGLYVLSLVVNDGFVDSDPGNMEILVVTLQDGITARLMDLIDIINSLDDSAFKNRNMRNTLTNKINVAIQKVQQAQYSQAWSELDNFVLPKTDGCAYQQGPDNNDWIIDCGAQDLVYPVALEIMAMLEQLF